MVLAAIVGSVATLSFLAGCQFSKYSSKSKKPKAQVSGSRLCDEEVVGQLSADQLRAFLRQLPAKPIGPRGQPASEVHSTARAILLCASGKGGVGKSTLSVNLAYMLQQMGLEVGLLDLDIYGPSLPELVRVPPDSARQNQAGRLIPIDYAGVALMSWGFIQPGQASTIRAPIANQIVAQLLTSVEWGALDVLVIDSPPGTGDVLLSLAQTLPVDGSVLVTTSNTLSLADVAKGLQLFDKVEIPALMVIRNMSCSYCEVCGHKQDLFADSSLKGLDDFLRGRNLPSLEIPLDHHLSQAPSSYQPSLAHAYPYVRNPENQDRPAWVALSRLSHAVLESILGVGDYTASNLARKEAAAGLRLRPGGLLEVRLKGGELHPISCGELRAACRCAHCVDDLTGEVKIDQDKLRHDQSLRARDVEKVGNYAVSVLWSDGHSTLVATQALARMVGGSTHVGGHGTW